MEWGESGEKLCKYSSHARNSQNIKFLKSESGWGLGGRRRKASVFEKRGESRVADAITAC